jgi:hypothetical protein
LTARNLLAVWLSAVPVMALPRSCSGRLKNAYPVWYCHGHHRRDVCRCSNASLFCSTRKACRHCRCSAQRFGSFTDRRHCRANVDLVSTAATRYLEPMPCRGPDRRGIGAPASATPQDSQAISELSRLRRTSATRAPSLLCPLDRLMVRKLRCILVFARASSTRDVGCIDGLGERWTAHARLAHRCAGEII